MTYRGAFNRLYAALTGCDWMKTNAAIVKGIHVNARPSQYVAELQATFATNAITAVIELPGASKMESTSEGTKASATRLRSSFAVVVVENPQLCREVEASEQVDALEALQQVFGSVCGDRSVSKNDFKPSDGNDGAMKYEGEEGGLLFWRCNFSIAINI